MIFPTNNNDLEIQIEDITLESSAYLIHAKIKVHKEYDDVATEIKEIGFINMFFVPNARWIDESLVDIGDSISQDLYLASYFANSHFSSDESITPDWLHISSIEIQEEFRGFKYGWFVVREMIKLFGTKSIVSGMPKEEWLIGYWKRFGLANQYKIPDEKPICFHDTAYLGEGFLEGLL